MGLGEWGALSVISLDILSDISRLNRPRNSPGGSSHGIGASGAQSCAGRLDRAGVAARPLGQYPCESHLEEFGKDRPASPPSCRTSSLMLRQDRAGYSSYTR